MLDIMILAQVVLHIFHSQDCFTIPKAEVGKGDNSAKYLKNFAKSKSGHPHLGYNLHANITILAPGVPQIFCSQGTLWVKKV